MAGRFRFMGGASSERPSQGPRLRLPTALPRLAAMRLLRIGLAQIDSTVGDLDGNFDRIVSRIQEARALGVDILVFPEMVLPGYPPED